MKRFVPASFFGIVIGLSVLGLCWRVAARVWALPPVIAEVVCAVATTVWLLLLIQYARKWIFARAQALAEVAPPTQCCFSARIFTASMLMAGVIAPYSELLAKLLYVLCVVTGLLFVAW